MPIYEYACEKCENEFEVEQRITEDPLKTCPKCRSRKVRRLISKTSFVLKGGGWYSDLYASNKSADGESDKKPDPASESVDAKKAADSDSKPKAEPAGADKGKGKAKGKRPGKGKSKAVA